MEIRLIAIGNRMPQWINSAFDTYAKRLPPDYQLKLIEIAAEKRHKTSVIKPLLQKEGKALLAARAPNDYCIALDRHGKAFDTETFSQQLNDWHNHSQNISLLIGGPEGLSDECLNTANAVWSLSKLTLPHPLVRIIMAEQIYRAWSILSHHPYHR